MCKVCSSLGQKWGNERAITGSKIILTSPFENVKMYPRWRPAVQNTCTVKITKSANMWEEIEVTVKNWEGPIPQYVAIATVKTN